MVGGVGGDVSQTVPQAFPLALDLVTGVHREGFFRFAGTCVPENETGQVPTLSSVHFLE